MWLEAFHLLVSLHHAYTTISLLLVDYTGVYNKYLIFMRDMGPRYLTVWNLVSEGFLPCYIGLPKGIHSRNLTV
jgi:hypothetical protein